MIRSLYTSVAALIAHQTKLDVTGNNIANVNTIGYKEARVTFEDVLSQTIRGASAPDPTKNSGGTNPSQVGLGMRLGSIDAVTTQGSAQRTDGQTDFMINGEGYFIVQAGKDGYPLFTRAGNFNIDKAGYLVNADGLNVMGWHKYTKNTDGTYKFDSLAKLEQLNIYSDLINGNKTIMEALPSTSGTIIGNLDEGDTAIGNVANCTDNNISVVVPVKLYDSLGNTYETDINLWKIGTTTDSDGNPATQWHWGIGSNLTNATSSDSGDITFTSDGKISTGNTAIQVTVTPDPSIGSNPIVVNFDLGMLTQFAAESSAKSTNVNGTSSGTMASFTVSDDGVLTAVYTNGQIQPLGMISLALFTNPAGLQRAGNNTFSATTNSGDFIGGVQPGTNGTGVILTGTLEMSNVDISKEFTDLITTQRGIQANARVVTASDEILQELVNLKR